MEIKKNLFFILLLCTTLNTTAQSVYSLLTAHEGYWLLYSERIEQYQDGNYLAQETFMNDEMLDAIMFDTDGILHSVSTLNGHVQTESWWRLEDQNKLILFDETTSLKMEVIEVSSSRLVLKYTEERPGGLSMAKISTYCFPDTRLSEEEAASLNNRGVYEIDAFTSRSGDIVQVEPAHSSWDDIETYRIFEPSGNSKYVARFFVFDYVTMLLPLPFEITRLLPPMQWEGVRDLTISMGGKQRMKFHCDEKGNVLYVDIEREEKAISIDYKDNVPLRIDAFDKEFDCYAGENYFFIETKEKDTQLLYETNDRLELLRRGLWNTDGTSDFRNQYFDETTKEGFYYYSHNQGEITDGYTFRYTNDGIFPCDIEYTVDMNDPEQRYSITKTENVISVTFKLSLDLEEVVHYDRELRIQFNEKNNIQQMDYFEEGEKLETIFYEYSTY